MEKRKINEAECAHINDMAKQHARNGIDYNFEVSGQTGKLLIVDADEGESTGYMIDEAIVSALSFPHLATMLVIINDFYRRGRRHGERVGGEDVRAKLRAVLDVPSHYDLKQTDKMVARIDERHMA